MRACVTYRDSRDVAYDHIEEDNEQKAKGSTFASSSLSVHFGERERSTAVNDRVKIGDAVQDCNDIAQSCEEA